MSSAMILYAAIGEGAIAAISTFVTLRKTIRVRQIDSAIALACALLGIGWAVFCLFILSSETRSLPHNATATIMLMSLMTAVPLLVNWQRWRQARRATAPKQRRRHRP